MVAHNMDLYKKRMESFDFNTVVVDGHDVGVLVQTFENAATVKDKPTVVIAKTYKVILL